MDKAQQLLLSHLEPFQEFTYRRWGFFYVKGSNGGTYGLWNGYWIAVVNGGMTISLLGAHPARYLEGDGLVHQLPTPDCLLIQKFMLETQADTVWEIGCKSIALMRMPTPLLFGKWEKRDEWPTSPDDWAVLSDAPPVRGANAP